MIGESSQAHMDIASKLFRDTPVMIEGGGFNGRYYGVPNVPDKVIRLYDPETIALERCQDVIQLLREMEEVWEIPTVHPQFVMTGRDQSPFEKHLAMPIEMMPISISDKIHDAIEWKDALNLAGSDPDVAMEFDALNLKLAALVSSRYADGGEMLDELMHVHQYVYSPSAPAMNRLVLVDIEPFRTYFVQPLDQPPTNETCRDQLTAIIPLIENLRHIEHATHVMSPSRETIEDMLETLPAIGRNMEELKMLLREMIDTQIELEEDEREFMDRMFGALFEWEGDTD